MLASLGRSLQRVGSYLAGPAKPAPLPPAVRLREKVQALGGVGAVLPYGWLDAARFPWLPARVRDDCLLALRHHPVIKPALLGKLFAVTSLDLQSSPADETPRDQEIAEFVLYQFTRVLTVAEVGLEVLYPALILKQSVCEMVPSAPLWPRGRWRGKRFVKKIAAKAGARVVYDQFREPVAVQGPGAPDTGWPLDTFLLYRHMPLFGDDGTSDLIAAHNLVTEYELLKVLRNIHLDKFTSPTVLATYDKSQSDRDEDGNEIDVMTMLQPRLEALKSRGYLAVPDGIVVSSLQLATRGEAEFLAALNDLEQKMVLSIAGAFLQALTAGGGPDMRGSADTQRSTSELFIWALNESLMSVLNRQAVPFVVNENYLDADYPTLSLGGINLAEANQMANVYGKAVRDGVKPSRKAYARATGIQLAADDADALQAPAAGPPGQPPGGQAFPFASPRVPSPSRPGR